MAASGVRWRARELCLVGLAVVLALLATDLLLRFLFDPLDHLLEPIIQGTLGRRIPGPGFLASVAIIFLIGILTTNSDFFLVVPENSVIPVPISVEETLKRNVSGGLIVPAKLQAGREG